MAETIDNDAFARRRRRRFLILLGAAVLATIVGVALLMNIFERKQEARNPFYRVVELTDDTEDPAVWGKNFPLQYDDYKRTVDQVRTRYGGSEAEPRTPTQGRSALGRRAIEDRRRPALEDDVGRLRVCEGFSRGARPRVHARRSDLHRAPASRQATRHVHSMPRIGLRALQEGGQRRPHRGLREDAIRCLSPKRASWSRIRWPASTATIRAPCNCGSRVPGLSKASARSRPRRACRTTTSTSRRRARRCAPTSAASATSNIISRDRRSGSSIPWAKGLKVEEIQAYYDEEKFKDWTHADTGAPVLKAQHPEFEMWNQGIHARSGVTCADCHMPYKREGALKISDHHVRSPLLNINRACQTCHKWPEEELKARVETIQERTFKLRNVAMDALMDLIKDLKAAKGAGKTDAELATAQDFQRKAQFYLDFVEAENSTGFHAPQEAARILGESIDFSRKGQIALRDGKLSSSASAAGKSR